MQISEYKEIKKIYNHNLFKKQMILEYIFTTLCIIYLILILIDFDKYYMPIIFPAIICIYASVTTRLEKKQIFIKYKYIRITKYRTLIILGDILYILLIYHTKINVALLLLTLPLHAFVNYTEYKRFVKKMNNL